ncbi:MAG: hypothetical protein HYT72_02775 [Candidatus Aenigmarchaeota archaeon]|nr:hypothetical protein [Candidatus Aenigmarchaeota archaeon]
MQDEISIAKDVKELLRGGKPFEEVRQHIRITYGLDLTPRDIDRYNSMKLPEVYEPIVQEPTAIVGGIETAYPTPPATGQSPYKKETPSKKGKSPMKGFGPLLVGASVGALLGATVIGAVFWGESRDREHKSVKQEQAANSQLTHDNIFADYILLRIGSNNVIVDFNRDGKPDGITSDSTLKAAADIMKLDVKVNAETLLRSLYEIHADDIIVRSPDQIITVTGSPPQYGVFRLEGSALTPNTEVQTAWNDINRQLLAAIKSNSPVEQKQQQIADAFQKNPYATSLTLNMLGGSDFERQLRENQGLEIANYFSGVVRGNLTDAAVSAGSGNFGAALGYGFAAWLNTQAAKAAIQGLESGRPATGSQDSNWTETSDGRLEYTGGQDRTYDIGGCVVSGSQLSSRERGTFVISESRLAELCK